jgi:hypothetical protein
MGDSLYTIPCVSYNECRESRVEGEEAEASKIKRINTREKADLKSNVS